MKEFYNQWAIIIGGSSGLGLATAKKLAKHGMNLCLVHRDRRSDLPLFEKEIKRLESKNIKITTHNRNALKPEEFQGIIREIPKNSVRLLLHSLAKGSLKTMDLENEENLTLDDFQISIHAMGLNWYEWTKFLIQQDLFMKNSRNIAFTSEGNQRVWPSYGAVSTAKSVLESLMRQMAVEWAKYGIRTNCIQAGTTVTPSFKKIPGNSVIMENTRKRNPFHRMTIPDDIANVVYLLCKNEANWINGTILKADGGESLR